MDHQLASILKIYFNVEELTRYLFYNNNILFPNDFFFKLSKKLLFWISSYQILKLKFLFKFFIFYMKFQYCNKK
jgi:hypothetical protein